MIDFSLPATQRQRRREHVFYRMLAASAVIGALPVLLLAWQLEHQQLDLGRASQLLEQELHTLQSPLAALAQIEQDSTSLGAQLQAHAALADRRALAPALLQAIATATPPALHLQQLGLRAHRAELRGHAPSQDAVENFIDNLRRAGITQIRLQELRIRHADTPQAGFSFVVALQAAP